MGDPSVYKQIIVAYDAEAEYHTARYLVSFPDPECDFPGLLPLLPPFPGDVLDVGAGPGRDAAWFAGQGHRVVAVEPSGQMLRRARETFPPSERLIYVQDSLPFLAALGEVPAFDLIFLNRVFMHVLPEDQESALLRLLTLLRPGGALYMVIRQGPPSEKGSVFRPMFPVVLDDLSHWAENAGEVFTLHARQPDHLGRSDVFWDFVSLQKK